MHLKKKALVAGLLLLLLFLLGCPSSSQQPDSKKENENVSSTNTIKEKVVSTNTIKEKVVSTNTIKEKVVSTSTIKENVSSTNTIYKPPKEKLFCDELKEVCQSHKGYPYVWGASTYEQGGFDCSGFVYSVFKKMNKPLPRTTSIKYWLMFDTEAVNWKDGECGSLVWWSINRPYGHIGILLNTPVFWQSGSSTGPIEKYFYKGGYWDKSFVAAKKTNLF